MHLRNELHIPPWFYVRLGPKSKVLLKYNFCRVGFCCLYTSYEVWMYVQVFIFLVRFGKVRYWMPYKQDETSWLSMRAAVWELHSASLISGCRCTWWLLLVPQEEVVTGRGWHLCYLHPVRSNVTIFNSTYATGESLRHGTTPNPSGLGTGSHIHPANKPFFQCTLEFLQHARGLAQDKALQCG